eukprot:6206687-Pleurochrysis_carterae.AAC.1
MEAGKTAAEYYRAAAPRPRAVLSVRPDNKETTALYKIQSIAGWELSRARGLGRACAVARVGGAHKTVAVIASEYPRARGAECECSASMHATRVEFGKHCIEVSHCK